MQVTLPHSREDDLATYGRQTDREAARSDRFYSPDLGVLGVCLVWRGPMARPKPSSMGESDLVMQRQGGKTAGWVISSPQQQQPSPTSTRY